MEIILGEKNISKVPMIAISDTSQTHQPAMMEKAGRSIGVVTKPINPSGLFNAIVDIFGHHELRIERRTLSKRNKNLDLRSVQNASALLVEDNIINQQVASELLRRVGVITTIAENGEKAVQMIKESRFDIVFMDIQMPVMDGLTAAKKIRNLGKEFENLPIVAMTAHAMKGDKEQSLEAGMNDHITKPIDPDRLYACLLKWIDSHAITDPVSASGEFPDKPDQEELKDRMPDINWEEGVKNSADNWAFYLQMLERFVRDYQNWGKRVKTALDASDMETAKRVVHTAKGLSATIGAETLHTAMKALQGEVNDHGEGIMPALEKSEIILQRVIRQISGVLQEKQERKNPAPIKIDDETLQNQVLPKLENLKSLCIKSDMASIDLFSEIKNRLDALVHRETQELDRAFDILDLDSALEIINGIIAGLEERLARG